MLPTWEKNTSVEILQEYCRVQAFTHLFVYLVTQLQQTGAHDYLQLLWDLFPDKIIIYSGPGFNDITATENKNLVLYTIYT